MTSMLSNNAKPIGVKKMTLEQKIAAQTTSELKKIAAQLANDFRDGADVVYAKVLDALELRMPEVEFIEFCNAN